jgi:molybdopterin molybdotransferase
MEKEQISLDEAAGRVLAADVLAQYDVPLFDKSPLDGYAFRAEDTDAVATSGKVTLTVTEEVAAGGHSDTTLLPGCAVKILTGAPIPAGANAVAKYEETEFGDTYVTLHRQYAPGENIVRQGEDVTCKSLISGAGTKIDSAVHGMLASQGIDTVWVYQIPRIGIISQGNELINPGEPLSPGKIYNSNRYLLGTALKAEGFLPFFVGDVHDDEAAIAQMLTEASKTYDAVVMTGGASVGTYDYTKTALVRAGAEIIVEKIRMKPGSACCLALLNGVPVFGLSGNPSAAMTTFHLVTMPAIRKIAGQKECLPPKIMVHLDSDFHKKSPNMRILKGSLDLSDGVARMKLNAQQTNGSVSSMRNAQVFAIVPAGSGPVKKDSVLEAYLV